MLKKQDLIKNIILLQSYYKFLYLGKYLEQEMKIKDFSKTVEDSKISTGEKSYFMIKGKMLKPLLDNIYKHPDKKNVFGHLVELSAFRGIISTMKELLDNEVVFEKFLKRMLKGQYFGFEQIVKLIRNILSHAVTPLVNMKVADFVHQKTYLQAHKKSIITFDLVYADVFDQWAGSKEYGIHIVLDFKNLKDNQTLFDVISVHQLYMLCELCYNISEVFRIKYKLK